MFNKTAPVTVSEPTPDVVGTAVPIPLSHLELDLAKPEVGGWASFLADRHIEIVIDDIGRAAISRSDARSLLSEQRELEARARELAAEQEARAVEADRRFRRQLNPGVHWTAIPAGVTAAEAMMRAGYEAERPKSVHEQLLERELSHSGPELVYQPLQDEG